MAGSYEKVAEAAMAELDGHMCWPVEWFKEDLPLESKDGSAMDMLIEKTINRSYHVPKMMDPYMNILVFADMLGYSKNLLANAPEGRISMKKVVENYHSLTQEDVKRLVTEPKKGWDLVIFAVGCDPPRSNSIEDIIEQNTVISRLYFWLSYEIQRAEGSARKIFCLVRGLFHEDKRTHMKAGLGITVCGTLFGMTNTLRQELEGVDLHFCDTEYFMEEDSPLWASVAAEAFRDTTFGMIDVRILESGRYVQKRVSSKVGVICISGGNGALGLVMGNWLLDKAAEQGKSGFQIQFLSRSMKISEPKMQHESLMEGCCNFIEKLNGELYGFIHSAGVLQDSMLMNLTWEKFETVYQSKHHAALFLHYALENNPQKNFQFMWNFSSTSVYGNMGQLNYSGSNSFLDVLTRHRKAKGKPTMNSPMPYFSNKEGLYGLECGLATGLAYFSVFKFNPPVMMGSVQYADVVPSCHHRNHYSEVCPTPPAPTLERKHYYTIYRTRAPWLLLLALALGHLHCFVTKIPSFDNGSWALQIRIPAGSLVDVFWKKELLASGFYDPHSPLRVRLLWWPGDQLRPDVSAWAPSLVRHAAAERQELEQKRCTGLRLLHGEADGTPGLILDVYGSLGVCGFDGRGAEAFWRPR
eukprot:g26011.t1